MEITTPFKMTNCIVSEILEQAVPPVNDRLIIAVISTKNEEKSISKKQISHSFLIRNDNFELAAFHPINPNSIRKK